MKVNNNSVRIFFRKKNNFLGFTLIELIVVLGLIGILATAVLAALNPIAQIQKANDAHRKADLETIQHALELYYQDAGRYPTSSPSFQIVDGATTMLWGNPWQPYTAKLPKDPSVTNTYVYYSPTTSNGQSYYLYASLERGATDPQACNKGSACATIGSAAGFPSANSCGGTCNYGVSSSNVTP